MQKAAPNSGTALFVWIPMVGLTDDAAVGAAEEAENLISDGRWCHGLFNLHNRLFEQQTALVDDMVDGVDLFNIFLSETTTTHAYAVDASIGDWLATHCDKRWEVFVDPRAALQHHVCTDTGELVDERTAAQHCIVANNDFACELHCVRHDDVVAKAAVVSYVAVSHHEVVIAHHGLSFGSCAAVNGAALAEHAVVAHHGARLLALEFQILWDATNGSTRKHFASLAQGGMVIDHSMGMKMAVWTDDGVAHHHSERIDGGGGVNACRGVDIS